jgi:hypothetical protein
MILKLDMKNGVIHIEFGILPKLEKDKFLSLEKQIENHYNLISQRFSNYSKKSEWQILLWMKC